MVLGGDAYQLTIAYEFHEEVERVLHLKQAKLATDAVALALDSAHATAFHSGLGSSLYPISSTPLGAYLNEHSVAGFSGAAYTKPNIAVVADGVSQSAAAKWIEPFFKGVPSSSASQLQLHTAATKYYGGEQRTPQSGSKSALVIAFPGYTLASDKPEAAVLNALLGGQSTIKWSPGFTLLSKAAAAAPGASVSSSNFGYTDAGLLAIQISGPATQVRKAAEEAVKALKSVAETPVSKENLTKAIAKAKFDLLSANELSGTGLVAAGTRIIHGNNTFQVADALKSYESVTADKLKAVSSSLLTILIHNADLFRRRPRDCWRARQLWLLWVTCLCCHMRKIWDSRYRLRGRGAKMYQQLNRCRAEPL